MFDKVIAHTSFIGETGYANHSRNFFTALNKLIPVKVRNFTIGSTWTGLNNGEPHNDEWYLTEEHKEMLYKQTCTDNGVRSDHYIYGGSEDDEKGNVLHIVLNEVNHYYFYDDYDGPKIAYNVWESTLYPEDFYNKILEFDQLWVPSKWQRDCVVKQGYDFKNVKVVPEAVDSSVFFPQEAGQNNLEEYDDGRFKFLLFGRWDYRKSIKEIINTFFSTFSKDEPVDLVVSIDNKHFPDGLTTEDRLKKYDILDERIKVKHFPSRDDYVKYLKNGNVFLSCARSEGWNLPLIEAMACGTPSVYSNWGAQLEFADGKGIPVDIKGEFPSNIGANEYFVTHNPGDYCEPDFKDLSLKMRDTYDNYEEYKIRAVEESKSLRNDFTWGNVSQKAYNILQEFSYEDDPFNIYFDPSENKIFIKSDGKTHGKYNVRVKDESCNLVIYQSDMEFPKDEFIEYWIIPFYTDFSKLDGFRGFIVEIANSDRVIFSKNIIVNELPSVDDFRFVDNHSSDLTWINYREMFYKKFYDHFVDVVDGGIVVDVGANRGIFTRYALVKGYDKCYSIEPCQGSFKELIDNFGANPKVKLLNAAVFKTTGKDKIYIPKTSDSISSMFLEKAKEDDGDNRYADYSEVEIETITLEDFVSQNNIGYINLLKVDVEGSEYEIFDNLSEDFLSNKIDKIILEFHFNNGEVVNIINKLKNCGFSIDIRDQGSFDLGDVHKKNGMIFASKNIVDFDITYEMIEKDNENTYRVNIVSQNIEHSCEYNVFWRDVGSDILIYECSFLMESGVNYWVEYPYKHMGLARISIESKDGIEVFSKILIFNEKEKPKFHHKLKTRKNDATWLQFREVFHEDVYLSNENIDIKEGDIVLDLGANNGFFSLHAIDRGALKVYAVEINKETYKYLSNNIDIELKYKNSIIPICCGVGGSTRDETITLHHSSGCDTICGINKEFKTIGTQAVKILDINELLSNYNIDHIDLLKIDIEGAEFEVFDSIDESFLTSSVDHVVGEIHLFDDHKLEEITNKLERCGFSIDIPDKDSGLRCHTLNAWKSVKKGAFVCTWQGDLPYWFDHFAKSCGANKKFDWLIFTEEDAPKGTPENIKFIKQSLDNFNNLAGNKLDRDVNVKNSYKLCDFKPLYGKIYEDYLRDYSYWGFCDIDVIWGDLDKFFNKHIEDCVDIISLGAEEVGGLHYRISGPCTMVKNTKRNNELFWNVPEIDSMFAEDEFISFDEVLWSDYVINSSHINVKIILNAQKFYNGKEIENGEWKNGKLYIDGGKEIAIYHMISKDKEFQVEKDTFSFGPPTQGIKIFEYDNYDHYKKVQIQANHDKINYQYADPNSLSMLCDYIQGHIPNAEFGLCHGVRNGFEQTVFKNNLGIKVVGTDISDTANQIKDTIQWDFNNIKEEWIDSVDFIYSNSFDHSYDPIKCLDVWMKCVKQDGICIIEWSHLNEIISSDVDPIYASVEDLKKMILKKYQIVDILTNDGINDEGATFCGERCFIIISHKSEEAVFVTGGDSEFLSLIEVCVRSIERFSKHKIIVYGYNCDVPFDSPVMIKKRIDFNEGNKIHHKNRSLDSYLSKIDCITKSMTENFKNFCWIDADSIVSKNVDFIFDRSKDIEEYPLYNSHLFDHIFHVDTLPDTVHDKMFKEFCQDRTVIPWVHANLILFNKENKWFFEEINKIYHNLILTDRLYLIKYSTDELIANYLFNKYKFSKQLGVKDFDTYHVNVFDKFFEEDWREGFKYAGDCFSENIELPSYRDDILVFHGHKKADQARNILDKYTNYLIGDNDFYIPGYDGYVNLKENTDIDTFSYTYKEIFINKEYNCGNKCTVSPGDVVFDCGANVGIFSRYAKSQGASEVYSFEPEKNNYSCLVKNSDGHNYNVALSDKKGNTELHLHSSAGGHSLTDDNTNDTYTHNDQEVETITLDDFINDNDIDRIDFLKVDTEGSEIKIFDGISDDNLRKVKKIAMEYHHMIYDFDKDIRNNFISRLNRVGFKHYVLFLGNNEHLQMIYFWRDDEKDKKPKVAYVTAADEKYMSLAEQCVKGINEFSNHKIVVYGLGCDVPFDYPCLIKKRMEVDDLKIKGQGDAYKFMAAKTKCDVDCIDNGDFDVYISLDADIVPTENIDKLIDFTSDLKDHPIFSRYRFEDIVYWAIKDDKKIIKSYAEEFYDFIGKEYKRKSFLSACGIYAYNKKSKLFFEEANSIRSKLIPISKESDYSFVDQYALSDEKIFNYIIWENGYDDFIPVTWFSGQDVEIGKDEYPITLNHYMSNDYSPMYIYDKDSSYTIPLPNNIENIVSLHTDNVNSDSKEKNINPFEDLLEEYSKKKKIDKLMIVSHPDDESIFGGNALLEEDGWKVICTTCGDDPVRRKEFEIAMKHANVADYEIWNFKSDLNSTYDEKRLVKKLKKSLDEREYEKIVTHNNKGEYGHLQHSFLNKVISNMVDNLFVFSTGDPLSNSQIENKINLLKKYESQTTNKEIGYPCLDGFKDFIFNESIIRDKQNIDKKKYLISFDSSSLGDNLAWMPSAEEFRKKHNCKVVLSTFWNHLFEKEYPEIEFIGRGSIVNNIHGQYNIGWYQPWNPKLNPNDFRTIPLQQTSTDILGMDYKEIRPKISIPNKPRIIKEKYVCIGMHSTCQSKYWNYPEGWQKITDYLNEKGYKVVHISKEQGEYMDNSPPKNIIDKTGDFSIEDRIVDLKHADMFIGLGSGLSWLSWAVGTPTILISGFSAPFCEPTEGIERIHNPKVCNSCFNDPNITFDPGDWNWCPRDKDFECSKSITPEDVIQSINKILS